MMPNGTESLTFLGPRTWEIVPSYIKKVTTCAIKIENKTMESNQLPI